MIPTSINNYHACSDLTQIYLPPPTPPHNLCQPEPWWESLSLHAQCKFPSVLGDKQSGLSYIAKYQNQSRLLCSVAVVCIDSGVRLPKFKSYLCYLLAIWPWVLFCAWSFLIYIIDKDLSHKFVGEMKLINANKVFKNNART